MRLPFYLLLTVLLLQACGGGGGAPTVAPPGPVNMDDLARYIVTAESDKAIVVNNASPFGNQAIRRTVISSTDDLAQIGQIRANSQLAIRFSKSATPAQMRQFAQYGKTALRNPRNAAILGALLATGVVVGYELLEDEDSDTPVSLSPQPGTAVAYADVSQLASKEDILKGLKTFKLSRKTLDAVSAELSLPTQKPSSSIAQSLTLSTKKLNTKAFLPPVASAEARIQEVNFSRSFRGGDFYLNISIAGQITNQTRTVVKARFFDPDGHPSLNPGSDYTDDSGQVEVRRELIGVISGKKFHQFPISKPLSLSLPIMALPNPKNTRCRIEVRHKSSGKLLAASALLPIQ